MSLTCFSLLLAGAAMSVATVTTLLRRLMSVSPYKRLEE